MNRNISRDQNRRLLLWAWRDWVVISTYLVIKNHVSNVFGKMSQKFLEKMKLTWKDCLLVGGGPQADEVARQLARLYIAILKTPGLE